MSIWRTQIIGLVATVVLFFIAQTGAAAETPEVGKTLGVTVGGYAPCMVQPVFIAPHIAPAIITKDEIQKPTFIRSSPHRWQTELADIEKPTFVEKIILQPRFDGCSYLPEDRKAAQKGVYYLPRTTSVTQRLGTGNIAARLLNAADQCCGNASGR